MASSNFNAGSSKFPQFNNVGGPKPKKTNTTGQTGAKESPSVQNDPQETMQFGTAPVADAKTDTVSTGVKEVALDVTPAPTKSTASSIPSQINGLNIAGSGSVGKSSVSFDGITARNGLNSTSFQTVGGKTLASVNPLNPRDAVRMPTTSIGALNGIESTSFVTSSGREISL